MQERNEISTKFSLRFLTDSLIMLFGLISLIFIKRYMGYEALGIIAYVYAFVGIFAFISDMGLGTAHIKMANDKDLDKSMCNGSLFVLKSFFVLVTIGIIAFLISISPNSSNNVIYFALFLALFKFSIEKFADIFKNIFSAELLIAKLSIPKLSSRLFQMLSKIAICLAGSYSVLNLIHIDIIAVIFLLLFLIYNSRNISFSFPNKYYIKKYLMFGIPVLFVGFVASVNAYMDRILIDYFLDIESVGIYYLAFRMSSPVNSFNLILTTLLFATFSKYFSRGKLEKIRTLVHLSVKYILILQLPLTGLLILFSDDLLPLIFGEDAYKSVNCFKIILLAAMAISLTTPYSIQVLSSGRLALSAKINLVALISNLILNVILIPKNFMGIQLFGLGVEGAALATFCTSFLRLVIFVFYAKIISDSVFYYKIWIHLLSNFLSFLTIKYMLVIYSELLIIPIYSLLYIFICISINVLLKEFSMKEMNFMINKAHPKNLYNYSVEEFKTVE